ncbi:hypothetical protein ACWEFL_27725 [Streptomyces sp. NPDC004838]
MPAPVPARRRGATTLLIAVAAVIGIVAGAAVGYGVQAERAPTPLPALSQPDLAYPAKPLAADARPAPLSAAEDRQVKRNGDLRKLLLPTPAGSRVVEAPWLNDGWCDLDTFFNHALNDDIGFEGLMAEDIRRVACAFWEGGDRRTDLRLVQFRTASGAQTYAGSQRGDSGYDAIESEGKSLKGSGNGRYYLYRPAEVQGVGRFHGARAVVQSGDIVISIMMFDRKPISENDIRTMAERQLERL